ncbi:MAG: 1-phosphofructokinase [Vibrio sp.]
MTKKVVTITLNPALDLTGNLDTVNVGSVSLVKDSDLHAAGKGVNVAKVLSDLGADVTVTGFLGADNQEIFSQLFSEMGAKDEFVRIAGSTRINVKLVETNGEVSDINFPGIHVNAQAIAAFESTLMRLAEDHDFFVIAGSLPVGVSAEQCASWIEKLHQMGKKVLFDSSRAALAQGLDAHPWLIKPNDEELAQFVGRELHTPAECRVAAEELADKGIENIVVSMGANGTMWFNQGEWLHAQPPRMNVVSTVGAGDTLVAGMCWGHMQEMEKSELVRFATALSALAVSQVGVGMDDVQALKTLQEKIQLKPVSTLTE